ncbi:hypothetical protein HDU78_006566 [Chytriomyces hyalinus]|nr:hypothetical protein HDU78_006566 [Chytriomyces hyalinus]
MASHFTEGEGEAYQIHGQNPQNLIEKIIRSRIHDSAYWKEHCFALTAETLVDKALDLTYIGGQFGLQRPTEFLCLTMRLLQLQPERSIIAVYLENEDHKYLTALAAFYLRLTFNSVDVYKYLEPLLLDKRKLRMRDPQGNYYLSYMDEFADNLLNNDRVCEIILPRITKRSVLVEAKDLDERISPLEEDLDLMMEDEENNSVPDEAAQGDNERDESASQNGNGLLKETDDAGGSEADAENSASRGADKSRRSKSPVESGRKYHDRDSRNDSHRRDTLKYEDEEKTGSKSRVSRGDRSRSRSRSRSRNRSRDRYPSTRMDRKRYDDDDRRDRSRDRYRDYREDSYRSRRDDGRREYRDDSRDRSSRSRRYSEDDRDDVSGYGRRSDRYKSTSRRDRDVSLEDRAARHTDRRSEPSRDGKAVEDSADADADFGGREESDPTKKKKKWSSKKVNSLFKKTASKEKAGDDDAPSNDNGGAGGGSRESMSIEETNKMRIALGMKPLKA